MITFEDAREKRKEKQTPITDVNIFLPFKNVEVLEEAHRDGLVHKVKAHNLTIYTTSYVYLLNECSVLLSLLVQLVLCSSLLFIISLLSFFPFFSSRSFASLLFFFSSSPSLLSFPFSSPLLLSFSSILLMKLKFFS